MVSCFGLLQSAHTFGCGLYDNLLCGRRWPCLYWLADECFSLWIARQILWAAQQLILGRRLPRALWLARRFWLTVVTRWKVTSRIEVHEIQLCVLLDLPLACSSLLTPDSALLGCWQDSSFESPWHLLVGGYWETRSSIWCLSVLEG